MPQPPLRFIMPPIVPFLAQNELEYIEGITRV